MLMSDFSALLTIDEVAEQIGCSRMHVYRLIQAGSLVPVDIAVPGAKRSRYRFTRTALTDFYQRSSSSTQPAADASA